MRNKNYLIIILILITIASITTTVIVLLKNSAGVTDGQIFYPPVPVDTNTKPIDSKAPSQPQLDKPEGGGAVSLIYSKEATAMKGDETADILFQNPSKSNQSIVIQLHISDSELISKIGRTGRTVEEMERKEGADEYNSETSHMVIAESGLIVPGNMLLSLKLHPLPDGTVLPSGVYNAVYHILAYDNETNERAVINMRIPITLTIIS